MGFGVYIVMRSPYIYIYIIMKCDANDSRIMLIQFLTKIKINMLFDINE